MDSVTTYVSNNQTYYLLEDIKKSELNVMYFVGCRNSMKKCILKQKIPSDKIVYMKNNKEYNAGYKNADVYVEQEYVHKHVLNVDEQQTKKRIKKEEDQENKQRKEFEESKIDDLPELLHLDDEHKFQNDDGVPMDIETRGVKTYDGMFFKASDIGKAFDIVPTTVLNVGSDYDYETDFRYFKKWNDPANSTKELYLTYEGVLKLLFRARGNKARFCLRKRPSTVLFTLQLGTQENKNVLAAEALNVDVSTVSTLTRKDFEQQRKDLEQRRKDLEQRRKDFEQQRQLEQRRKDFEQQRQLEQRRKDLEQRRKDLEQRRKDFEQQRQLERKDHVNEILTMKSKIQEAELNYKNKKLILSKIEI